MINLLHTSKKKIAGPQVNASYNRLFMFAWFNLEITSQEDKLEIVKGLLDRKH